MPVLIVSENTCPHVGFSRKRSMQPVLGGDHHAEVERVRDALERDRDCGAALLVKRDDFGQIDVGDRVTGDDQERLVWSRAGTRRS